jgi:hypothetical protein
MTGPTHSRLALVARAVFKNLLLSAVAIAFSAALAAVDPRLGSVAMLVTSAWMLLRSYRREWPLHWITCLLPAVTATACFFAQATLIGEHQSAAVVPPAILVGLGVGLLRGRAHDVFVRGGRVFARKTWLYLAIWIGCMLLTQGAALLGLSETLSVMLGGGAFSTTMIVVMSLVLFRKFRIARQSLGAVSAAAVVIVFAVYWTSGPGQPALFAQSPAAQELPAATIGQYYSQAVPVRGAVGPLQWSLQSGALPDGLQLDAQGTISGTPSSVGTSQFVLGVTTSDGRSAQGAFSITVGRPPGTGTTAPGRVEGGNPDLYQLAHRLLRDAGVPDGFEVLVPTSLPVQDRAARMAGGGLPYLRELGLPPPAEIGIGVALHRDAGEITLLPARFGDAAMAERYFASTRARASNESRPGDDTQGVAGCSDRAIGGYDSSPDAAGGKAIGITTAGRYVLIVTVFLPDSLYYANLNDVNSAERRAVAEPRRRIDTSQIRDRLTCSAGARLAELTAEQPGRVIDGSGQGVIETPPLDLLERLRQMLGGTRGGGPDEEAAIDAGLLAALFLLFGGATVNVAASVASAVAGAAGGAVEAAAGAAAEASGSTPSTDATADEEELAAEARERAESSARFWQDAMRDPESARRENEARAPDGYAWNEEQQTYVRDPAWRSPDERRVDEYYRRGDWLEEHAAELPGSQRDAAERIFDRSGWRSHGVEPGDVSEANLDSLRRLTHAAGDSLAGARETESIEADRNAEVIAELAGADQALAMAGQMAASGLESRVLPFTHGAVSAFVFNAAQNWDAGLGAAVENGTIAAGEAWVGGRLSSVREGSLAWQAATGGLTGAAGAAVRGGGLDEMGQAAAEGAGWGVFGAVQHRVMSGASGTAANAEHAAEPAGPRPHVDATEGRTPAGRERGPIRAADTSDAMTAIPGFEDADRVAPGRHMDAAAAASRKAEGHLKSATTTARTERENLKWVESDVLPGARKYRDRALEGWKADPTDETKALLDHWNGQVKQAEHHAEVAREKVRLADEKVARARDEADLAYRQHIEADPRRHVRVADQEATAAGHRVEAAQADLEGATQQASKIEEVAQRRPDDPLAASAVERAHDDVARARERLDDAHAARARAEESVRRANERLETHVAAETIARDRIDGSIRDTFDLPPVKEGPGELRITDLDELRRERGSGAPDGLLGFNSESNSRAVASEHTAVHERVHANTSTEWRDAYGSSKKLNEGLTEHLTWRVLERQEAQGGVPWERARAYVPERETVERLEKVVGLDTLSDAFFKGKRDTLERAIGESLGVTDRAAASAEGVRALGLLDKAMDKGMFQEANRLLEQMKDRRYGDAWRTLRDLEDALKA